MARMKRKTLQKLIVYGVSLFFMTGLAIVFLFYQGKKEGQGLDAQQQETAEIDVADSEMALGEEQETTPEMSQEEREVLNDPSEEEGELSSASSTYVSPIDFEGMREINKDVYAWITVPGTTIDYPILQHETDDTYYLNHNIDGSLGYPGCIYTESMNGKGFTDNNTVIYGHNMKNGTMFADLHKYEDEAFLRENDSIVIYTPEKELHYTIFAAYIYDDRHLLYSFDFADSEVYGNYLDSILSMESKNAVIRDDANVTKKDKIITLATCIASQPEDRLLVQAVLKSE